MNLTFTLNGVKADIPNKRGVSGEVKEFFGVRWNIGIFPKGELDSDDGQVGVFLYLQGTEPLSSKFTIILKDQFGDKDIVKPILEKSFDESNRFNHGWSNFILRSEFFDTENGYCVDGNAVFVVNIELPEELTSKFVSSNWWNGMSSMLFNDKFSDLTVIIDEVNIPAHKMILNMKSPVFKAMFENTMSENSANQLIITDFSIDAFKSFLTCIYDCTAIFDEIPKYPKELLALANKYEVTDLTTLSEGCIISTLTTENSIEILQFADLHNNKNIKQGAMKFMLNNASISFCTPGLVERLGPILCTELFTFLATNIPSTTTKN
jgi:hypothetical protein